MTAVQLAPLAKHIYHSILPRCDELPEDVIRTVAENIATIIWCKDPVAKELVENDAISVPVIYLPETDYGLPKRKAAVLLHLGRQGIKTILKVEVDGEENVLQALASAAYKILDDI